MEKMYYIKSKNYELAERQQDKLRYLYEELNYNYIVENNLQELTKEEYEKQLSDIYKAQEQLDNAMNNVHFEGFKAKAYWKYVEVINYWANVKATEMQIVCDKLRSQGFTACI